METNIEKQSVYKNKKILISIAVIILLAASAFFAYARLDYFKTPKLIYLESEYKTLNQSLDMNGDSFNKYISELAKQTIQTDAEVSANIQLDGLSPQEQQILDLINESKLIVHAASDHNNKKQYAETMFYLSDEPLIELEFAVDQDKMYLGVPEIYPKYALLDFSQTEILEEKGFDNLPRRYITYQDWIDALSIPKEEWKPLATEYALWYKDQLQDSQFTMEKNAEIEIQGEKYKARKITVTFTDEEWKSFLKAFTEKWSSDERVISLTYSRYENILTLLEDSGAQDLEKLSETEWKENIEELKNDTLKGIEEIRLADDVKMVLYTDNNDHILHRQFTIKTLNSEQQQQDATFQFFMVEKGDTINEGMTLTIKDPATQLLSTVEIAIDQNDGKVESTFLMELNDDRNSYTSFLLESTVQPNKEEKTRDSLHHLAVTSSEFSGNFELDIHQNESFGKPVELPQFNEENTLDIARLTEQDLILLEQEITQAFFEYYQQNSQKWMPLMQLFQPY